MAKSNPAIVVVAHERDRSLERLLRSISKAHYDSSTDLVISIDGSENDRVYAAAETFRWDHGKKDILRRQDHLGLKEHILSCGDLAEHYDSVILLEDDLFVSPYFYRFAKESLDFYQQDKKIAGVSLYSQHYNETSGMGFNPLADGSDVFFLQLASSWGQCWTKEQWAAFRQWYGANKDKNIATFGDIPLDVQKWPMTSWKKYFILYMIDTDKYFVYPRLSLSTNFHEPGVHHKSKQTRLQVPLQVIDKEIKYSKLEDSIAVYDAFHEILPEKLKRLVKDFDRFDFEVDFYGQKDVRSLKRDTILTSRECSDAVCTYGRELKPIELNIVCGIEGDDIRLAKTKNCKEKRVPRGRDNLAYYYSIPIDYVIGDGESEADGAQPVDVLTWARRKGETLWDMVVTRIFKSV